MHVWIVATRPETATFAAQQKIILSPTKNHKTISKTLACSRDNRLSWRLRFLRLRFFCFAVTTRKLLVERVARRFAIGKTTLAALIVMLHASEYYQRVRTVICYNRRVANFSSVSQFGAGTVWIIAYAYSNEKCKSKTHFSRQRLTFMKNHLHIRDPEKICNKTASIASNFQSVELFSTLSRRVKKRPNAKREKKLSRASTKKIVNDFWLANGVNRF